MGFLDFNIAEIASRIVRGASVRGRIRPTLDDGIIPTAQVADYTQAPFRLDEIKCFSVRVNGTGGAGNGCNLGIMNNTSRPVVVEWWRAVPRTAAFSQVRYGFSPGMFGGIETPFITQEGTGGVPNGPFQQRIIPGLVISDLVTVGADSPSQVIDNFELGASGVGPANSIECTTDILLAPGNALKWCNQTLNNAWCLAARVRVIQNISLLQ